MNVLAPLTSPRWLSFVLVAVLAGCGGDDAAATADGTPELLSAEPMAGGLHVSWNNTRSDCDAVEGERKGGGGEYAKVFEVPGAADNKHDGGPLVVGTAYMYRVRCKRGATYSAYSNEVSGTATAP